jgi:Legionella pneumophila major outer membrane protein precursor
MTNALKKIQLALTALVMTVIGHAHAEYDNSYGTEENYYAPNDFCEPQNCEPEGCGRGYITAGLIYWRPFEGGIRGNGPTKTTEILNPDGSVVFRTKSHEKDSRFRWYPGFRIAAGYTVAENSWDVEAEWTHFRSHSGSQHNHHHHHDRHRHHHHWKLDVDILDITAGKEFGCQCFKLRPYAGVREVQIKQRVRTHFISSFTFEDSTSVVATQENNRQTFLGVGPLVGIEGDWVIGCGFSIYASVDVSTLYGHFRTKLRDAEELFPIVTDVSHRRRHQEACQFVLDSSAGIRWETSFYENYKFLAQFGWEQHRYFNLNQFGGYGDLCLDGVNVTVGVGF